MFRGFEAHLTEPRRCHVFKRLVVATSVSALAVLGSVGGATAADAPKSDSAVVVKVAKFKAPKPPKKAIDWDAPAPAPGGISTLRIDWD